MARLQRKDAGTSMDFQTRQFIRENSEKKKPEEIARILGLKERHVRREIERQKAKQKLSAPKQEAYGFVLPNLTHLLFVFFLFSVLIGAIYSNTLQASFHFDDNYYIRENLALRDLANLRAIWLWDPPRFLPNLTFALNYHFGGVNVLGYHLVNILIHIAASLMVYFFMLALFQTPRLKSHSLSERSKDVALLAGLLFASHPIQIQAVTYIVQRHAAFATLFYVTTCFLYVCARLRLNKKIYWVAVLFCIASMFTKQITFTLPIAILVIEFFLFPLDNSRFVKDRVKSLTPFLVTIIIIPMLRLLEMQISPQKATQLFNTAFITPLHYLLTQFNVIREYLRFLFWPSGQSIYHSFPISFTLMEPKTLLSLGLLIALFSTALALRKKQPAITFGIFWFFLTLFVESSILPIAHVIFEHRMYLPMVGLCLAFSALLVSIIKSRKVLGVIAVFFVAALCFVTYQRNEVWKTDESLWKDAAKKYKNEKRQLTYDEGVIVRTRAEDVPFSEWKHDAQ